MQRCRTVETQNAEAGLKASRSLAELQETRHFNVEASLKANRTAGN